MTAARRSRTSWPERRRIAAAALALALAAAGACAAPLEDPERFLGDGGVEQETTCPDGLDVEADIMAVSCGGALCHAGDQPAANLDLVTPGIAERTIGVTTTCAEMPLVAPGDPDGSLMYTKLLEAPPCGARMPLGQAPLSAEEMACVYDWIDTMQAARETR